MRTDNTKAITIRIPVDLLRDLTDYRTQNGTSVTWQLSTGGRMFLDSKKDKK